MDKKVIFIVEDDPGFNTMMTTYLTSKHKWEIHSFESGEECLKQLGLKPVIFLQDFDLPGMNGIDVFKQVKRGLPDTEFVFLSGQMNIKVAVEALQLGAFDYIVKDSYAKETALNKIDQILKIKGLQDEKRADKQSKTALLLISLVLIIILAGAVAFKLFKCS
jgi:two-component system, NtrC family, response regulator AtoC